jgi:dynactin complex subunit
MYEEIEKAVKYAINKKYGSLRNFAEALGVSDGTLHTNIKRLSDKFILRMIELGIELPSELTSKFNYQNTNINTMKGNSRNEVNYNNNTGNSEGIEKLNQEIEMLKKENELLKKYKELADNEKDFRDRERDLYLDKIDSLTKQIKELKGD